MLVSVLTRTPALPSREEFRRASDELFPGAKVGWEEQGAALTLTVNRARARVVPLPGPVPNAEADTAAFLSLSSVNGRWRLPPHSAHLALRMEDAMPPPLERLVTFTRLVAAVTRASDALGVYWSDGPVTHAPEFFVDLASDTELPLPLWVGVSVTPEPRGRASMLSFGMKQLGLPDLLLSGSRQQLDDTLDFFFSALATVAERGQAPVEGETIRRSLLQRPKVRYQKSPVDDAALVWRLEL